MRHGVPVGRDRRDGRGSLGILPERYHADANPLVRYCGFECRLNRSRFWCCCCCSGSVREEARCPTEGADRRDHNRRARSQADRGLDHRHRGQQDPVGGDAQGCAGATGVGPHGPDRAPGSFRPKDRVSRSMNRPTWSFFITPRTGTTFLRPVKREPVSSTASGKSRIKEIPAEEKKFRITCELAGFSRA